MKPIYLWLGVCLHACQPPTEAPAIYLKHVVMARTQNSEQFVRIARGERKQLAASVERSNGSQDKTALNWSSEDSRIAQVDAQGILTGITPGKTSLILRSSEEPTQQVRITVEVEAPPPDSENNEAELSDRSDQ
jgi:hypothetical protein